MGKGVGSPRGGTVSGRIAKRLISRAGGVVTGASYLRSGMRGESMTRARNPFVGASKTEANQISLAGERVRVNIWKEKGRWKVALEDGRHRAIAAKEAGATKIRAQVTVNRPGQRPITSTTTVRL